MHLSVCVQYVDLYVDMRSRIRPIAQKSRSTNYPGILVPATSGHPQYLDDQMPPMQGECILMGPLG
jgi:hypothetical protein